MPHIALGPGGMVAVAGSTSSVGMKVSPNGIQTSSGGGAPAVLNSDGTPLLETYLGGSATYIGSVSCGSPSVGGLAFDAEGMLYASGVRPVTTAGVIQTEAPVRNPGCVLDPANEIGFLYRIDTRSGRVLFSTMLGGETGAVRGLYTEGATAWIGGKAGASFPVTAEEFSRGPGLLSDISSDGASAVPPGCREAWKAGW